MPRTRQVKKITKPDKCQIHDKQLVDEILDEIEQKKASVLRRKELALTNFSLKSKAFMLSLSPSLLNMKIGELKQKMGGSWQNISNISTATTFNSILKNNTTTKKISSNDEGYLTSESSTGSSGSIRKPKIMKHPTTSQKPTSVKKTKRSISLSRNATVKEAPLMKTVRRTRSASRVSSEEIPGHILASSNKTSREPRSSSANRKIEDKFKTPKNKKLSTFGFITPKVKPNTPQVVFRRPQMGEMALSLQGSPIMTTAVVTETTANLNIPLPDGRLMNIQPLRGLQPSELPYLDPEVRKQLETLKENLDTICKFSSSK